MARTKGSYSLSANIEINAAAPLDARERVATLADLTAEGSFPYHYVGMETYVVATGKKYRLTGSDPTVSANWAEIGEGGSGSGGHTIEDSTGTDMTSRANLQFKGAASVSDDSENDRTVVEVPIMPSSDMSEIIYPLPTPPEPSELSDLGDVDLSSPTNGQVLKYNSSTSKWENDDDAGGTIVVANPVESATEDLTKLQVGTDIYSIPEGINVVANPSGTASTDLEKLQVGNTIYNIPEDTDALADLTDVAISSETNGQILKYNASAGKWVNSDESAGGHVIENSTGTDMTERSNLQFKGAAQVSDDSTNDRTVVDVPIMPSSDMSEIISPLPTPAEPDDLDDLGDVTITTPTNGQVLKYDSESSKWVNANESGGGGGTGGHVIEDSTGTDMTARANLQFTGVATVSDDSTNDRTIVDVPAMPSSDMSEIIDPLPTPSTGTTVVPNPSEPATDSLTKLQVGETVYGLLGFTEMTKSAYDLITPEPNVIYFVYDNSLNRIYLNNRLYCSYSVT